jgi:tetratricopeptide (TPR) repeat protein
MTRIRPIQRRKKDRASLHTSQPRDSATTSLSVRKRLVFSLIMIALPFLLLGLMEMGLRLIDYGPNLSLFTVREVHGQTYYLLNHQVKSRYFPGIQFTRTAARDYFRVPKPQGTFRIFVLGGSTAAGYPYGSNASFASFLRQRLAHVFPDRSIEVINLGMTGTNSYTVLDLVRELPAVDPDLLIIYDGHNEFYGGLGVLSSVILGSSRFANLAYLQLLRSRTFLLLRDVYTRLRALLKPSLENAPRDVTLESLSLGKTVAFGSPRYVDALRTFEENLKDICSVCAQHHVPIIFGTQVSNLRGQPPFSSGRDPSLSAAQNKEFEEERLTAEKAWNNHRWADALRAYRRAASIDSVHAATHFAIGRCLDILGKRHEARIQYVLARDYDQLRFRTSTDFNRAILLCAKGGKVAVVNMERLFMAYSPDSLIGNELILEHLHPNSFGYFLMAKGYMSAIRGLGLIADSGQWIRRDTADDSALWSKRTVTELDERIALERTARLTSTYPFSSQSLSVPAAFPDDSLQVFARRVVDGLWGSGEAHLATAEYETRRGDLNAAEREYETLISLDSLEVSSYIGLAKLYIEEKRYSQASAVLATSLKFEPSAATYSLLGNVALDAGDNASAAITYKQALLYAGSPEEVASLWYHLALAESRMLQTANAEEALLKALAASPQHQPSLMLLRALHDRKRIQ